MAKINRYIDGKGDEYMGLYVNPGNIAFKEAVNSMIYVDKSEGTEEVFIPNREIAQEFCNVIDSPGWEGVVRALSSSEELLKNTWALNGKAVN